MNENIYQHFRQDERELIDHMASYLANVIVNYAPVLTEFLNPRARYIMESLVRKNDAVTIQAYGGVENADRQRILCYPDYFTPNIDDWCLTVLEIDYPVKFNKLTHGQILGVLTNIGVKREIIGDIITDGSKWQVIVAKSIAPFLISQVDRIGRVKVKLVEKQLTDLIQPQSAWVEEHHFLTSKRLDNLVASGFHLSRTSAKDLILNAKVQVNWTTIERTDYQIAFADVISVRGYGRIRLDAIDGKTHKNKLKARLSLIRK